MIQSPRQIQAAIELLDRAFTVARTEGDKAEVDRIQRIRNQVVKNAVDTIEQALLHTTDVEP
jgi:hypothetical protein